MGSDAERIIGLYQRHAEAWDSDRNRTAGKLMEKSWLDAFAGLLPEGGSVLDIGCGSGSPMAAWFIAQGFAVTGVDSAPGMIALCCSRFPAQRWHVADMRMLALSETFDGLVAWDSFFHLSPEDQRAMFPIFRAHAAPRAPLLFTSGPRHGEAIGSFRGEPLYHASLDPTEYRALLDANGFSVVRHVIEDPACGGHTVWLAQRGDN